MSRRMRPSALTPAGFVQTLVYDSARKRVIGTAASKNTIHANGFTVFRDLCDPNAIPNQFATNVAPSYAHVGSSIGVVSSTATVLGAPLAGDDGGAVGRKWVGSLVNAIAQTAAIGTAIYTWQYANSEFTAPNSNTFGEVGLFLGKSQTAGDDVSDDGWLQVVNHPLRTLGLLARATFNQTVKNSNMQISFTYQMRFST